MENVNNLPGANSADSQPTALRRLESANEFLEICDRLNTGYESGLQLPKRARYQIEL